jgi:hypothetical protein
MLMDLWLPRNSACVRLQKTTVSSLAQNPPATGKTISFALSETKNINGTNHTNRPKWVEICQNVWYRLEK